MDDSSSKIPRWFSSRFLPIYLSDPTRSHALSLVRSVPPYPEGFDVQRVQFRRLAMIRGRKMRVRNGLRRLKSGHQTIVSWVRMVDTAERLHNDVDITLLGLVLVLQSVPARVRVLSLPVAGPGFHQS